LTAASIKNRTDQSGARHASPPEAGSGASPQKSDAALISGSDFSFDLASLQYSQTGFTLTSFPVAGTTPRIPEEENVPFDRVVDLGAALRGNAERTLSGEGLVPRELDNNEASAAADAFDIVTTSAQIDDLSNGRSPRDRRTRDVLMQALMPGAGGGGGNHATAPPLLPTVPRSVENTPSVVPNAGNAPEGFASKGSTDH